VAEVCRKHGMSSATFYAWGATYGGMDVSEAKRLKALGAENAKLKRLHADAMLDNAGLKEFLAKSPADERRGSRQQLKPSHRRYERPGERPPQCGIPVDVGVVVGGGAGRAELCSYSLFSVSGREKSARPAQGAEDDADT
jgi:putative transposase